MKSYHWTETAVDGTPDEWVPADVAQGLYDALIQARSELEDISLEETGEAYNNLDINYALAAADGDEV